MMTLRAIAPSLVESSPKSRKKPENSPCWRPTSIPSLGHWGRVVSKLELTRCATPWAVFSPRNFPAMLSPSRNLVTTAVKVTHEYRLLLVQVSAWPHDYMERDFSRVSDSFLSSQVMPCPLKNPKFLRHFHSRCPRSHPNLVHTFTPYFFEIIFLEDMTEGKYIPLSCEPAASDIKAGSGRCLEF